MEWVFVQLALSDVYDRLRDVGEVILRVLRGINGAEGEGALLGAAAGHLEELPSSMALKPVEMHHRDS